MRRRLRAHALVLAITAAIAGALVASPGGAAADSGQSWNLVTVGAFGGEPSIASDPNGVLYETTPGGKAPVYRSTDDGQTWSSLPTAWTSSGDDCVTTDQAGSLYWCNLGNTAHGPAPLQADSFTLQNAATCSSDCTWVHGQGQVPDRCDTSCQPFGVDRQWLAASIPSGGTPDNAEVILTYHDFYGPSSIWINKSTDGGKTFGPSTNVIAPPAVTPGAVTGSLAAEGYTFCSTVPAGVSIVPPGKPHAGRIIVGWIASDPVEDGAGCNLSQYETFHTLWVSYSDDGGTTWTPQLAYDAGPGHDTSTPFVGYTTDTDGNPYFGFATNGEAVAPACGAESTAGTVQTDSSCQYNMYVVWSKDAGATWDGGGGTIPGSAAAPYRVNPPSEGGTHWFPAIAAAGPGQVDVSYLRTPSILPTGPSGKADPGGCAASGKVTAGACKWDLYTAQSSNLTAPPGQATWTTTDVTPDAPIHVGDICNLGIACVGSLGSNRHLLDFIQEAVDPTTGCGHVAYADDNTVNKLRVANQTSGCFAGPAPALAETPWTVLLPLAAIAMVALLGRRRRMLRRS